MLPSSDTPLRTLAVPRLDSIRNKILAFALLATLVPSAITLGFAYTQSRRTLQAKINQELLSESAQSAREVGVSLKERLYDLRVFAGSDEVGNSLATTAPSAPNSPMRGRLREYLVSLQERFPDYDRLLVLDASGKIVAASATRSTAPALPDNWLTLLRSESQLVGDMTWDDTGRAGRVLIAVPVQRADGRMLGAFAAELNVRPLREQLSALARNRGSVLHLLNANGTLITTSGDSAAGNSSTKLSPNIMEQLRRRENATFSYRSFGRQTVVGTYKPVSIAGWAVVSEIPEEDAFSQVRRFRNLALLVVLALLLVVAASAYRFGVLISRPLDRLTRGAAEVAAGDLEVDLPAAGAGEVGMLTGVFNEMVARLREGRTKLDAINETLRAKNEELEKLSITDGLTGLANHRFLMQRLNEEAIRSSRSERPFSVLMVDVDHFKQYNDSFGHPAGDEILKSVAHLLRECTRTVDCVGRYGGEEFAIIMPETDNAGAIVVAERIRTRIADEEFPNRAITLSIGLAEFPGDASTAPATIAIADQALYQAKRAGRDRVSQARDLPMPPVKTDATLKPPRATGKAARKKG